MKTVGSFFAVILLLAACTADRQHMRERLQYVADCNRADTVFTARWLPTADSLARYFTRHGNLTNINRSGWTISLPIATPFDSLSVQALPESGSLRQEVYGTVDSLTATYNGNQLLAVSNAVTAPLMLANGHVNFADGASASVEYAYDANGNLIQDLNKGLSTISYNAQNLPDSAVFSSGRKINYVYSADGVKRQVTYTTHASSIVTPIHSSAADITAGVQGGLAPGGGGIISPVGPITGIVKTFDYCGNAIYEDKVLTTLLFDGGYVSYKKSGTGTYATYTPTYHFYMKDHLGSNRVVASSSGKAEQVNHYYPYGSTFYGEKSSDQRFKYCGKELDKMHGLDWYDSSARFYDHVLCRFHQIDPLAEKYYSWSPYAYCHNNPMNRIDPDGDDDYYSYQGHFLFHDDNKTDNIIIRDEFSYAMKQMTGAEWINPDKPIGNVTLSAEAYSNIFTDILSKMNEINNADNLYNGAVSVVVSPDDYHIDSEYNSPNIYTPIDGMNNAVTEIDNGQIKLTANIVYLGGYDNRYLFSTISNVQNLLGIHEYKGHGLLRWGNMNGKHKAVYELQMRHRTWQKTTDRYKKRMIENSKNYK